MAASTLNRALHTFFVLTLALAAPTLANAATCPNFGGSYKIIKAASENTAVSIQQSLCDSISVSWTETDGSKIERKYVLDGKDHSESDQQGTRVVTQAKATANAVEYRTSYYEASTQALRFTIDGKIEMKDGTLFETQNYTTEQSTMMLSYPYSPKQ